MMIATLTAAACSGCLSRLPLERGASTLVVTSVLNALQDTQVVLVQRTVNGAPDPLPVDSATVTITGPDGVAMTGVEAADLNLGKHYQLALSAFHEQLVPGATYQLSVTLTTGERVTGTTTIPAAQPVSAPTDTQPFNAATDTLRLNWPPVQGAASYEVNVNAITGIYTLFSDTTVALPGTLRSLNGDIVFGTISDGRKIVPVTVAAVDANYYRYYRTNSDEFAGAAVQGNLTGAQGVFGSIVVVGWQMLRLTSSGH